MNYGIDFVYLSQQDIVDAQCIRIERIISIVEDALKKYKTEAFISPPKVATIFDEKSQNRINCLPGGIVDKKIYGMKWISVFPDNPHLHDCPNISAVILLSDMTTGYPIAFMDGALCTALRTAGVSSVAASYLAKKDSSAIGFVGAGEQAKMHFVFLKKMFPGIKTCKVSSRTSGTESLFIEQLSSKYPDVRFVPCNSEYSKAVTGSDIVVSAISGQEKIIQKDWISPGTFYCHVAGLEDDFSVALKADKIVCDDWESVKHRTQTLSIMYKKGLIHDSDIYANLNEIVNREKAGRENSNEFIYFNAVGLSCIDLEVANYLFRESRSKNKGTTLNLQSRPFFEADFDKALQ